MSSSASGASRGLSKILVGILQVIEKVWRWPGAKEPGNHGLDPSFPAGFHPAETTSLQTRNSSRTDSRLRRKGCTYRDIVRLLHERVGLDVAVSEVFVSRVPRLTRA
jgi:hypothetical protein